MMHGPLVMFPICVSAPVAGSTSYSVDDVPQTDDDAYSVPSAAPVIPDQLPFGAVVPITVRAPVAVTTEGQRAYDDLEREGLVQSRRGKGFWVAPIPGGRKQKMAENRFSEALEKLVAHAAEEGLSGPDMRRILDELLKKGAHR